MEAAGGDGLSVTGRPRKEFCARSHLGSAVTWEWTSSVASIRSVSF